MDKIHVGIVDDHKIVRDGLKAMFLGYEEIALICESESAEDFIKRMPLTPIHVLIVDLNLPGMQGEQLIQYIKANNPSIEILVLSSQVDEKSILASINAGARSYISKDAGEKELVEAIKSTYAGEEYFIGKVSKIIFQSYSRKKSAPETTNTPDTLSNRELDVLKLFAEGLSYKEIGERLFISPRTVETHKNHIMEKLGLANLADLIKFAIRNNIIQI
jgi:DNA-binding NarL/FixJ family response regulator